MNSPLSLAAFNPFRWLRDRAVPRLAFTLSHRPGWCVTGALLAFTFFAYKSYPLVMARDLMEIYDVPKDAESRAYKDFKKIFPNEFFLVAFERKDLFTPSVLEDLSDLTRTLEDMEGVRRVLSMANVRFTEGAGDTFTSGELLEAIPRSPAEILDLQRRAERHPLVARQLLSSDGRATAIAVFPESRTGDPDFRVRLLARVRQALVPYETKGYQFHFGGTTAVNVALAQHNERDAARFTGLMYLFLTLTLVALFRNPRWVALAVLNIVLVVTSIRGFAGWMGMAMNNFSIVSLPLGMALSLSDTVHVFTHLNTNVLADRPGRREALRRVLSGILYPCLLTSINTGLGFLSLTVNRVEGLRQFAVLASAGMAFEFLYTFFLMTPALLLFRPESIYRPQEASRPVGRLLSWVDGMVHAHPRAIVLTAGVVAVFSFGGALGLKVNTNLYGYFHADDPVRSALSFIESRFSGVETIDVSLESNPGAFKDPRTLALVSTIQNSARSLPGVDAVLSINDVLAMVNRSFHNENDAFYLPPITPRAVDQLLLLYGQGDLEDFVSPAFDRARILVRCRYHDTDSLSRLIRDLRMRIDAINTSPVRVRITGQARVDIQTANAVVQDMTWGILTSILSISLVMFFVLESLPLTLLFLVPNVLPILINFALMRFLGMSLSAGNSLIAAAAFGMIIDDTVHYFTSYVVHRKKGMSLGDCVDRLIASKGEASFSSFFVLAMAFGVLMTSQFKPTFQFGFLNIAVLLTGIASDQLVLNALLVWLGHYRNQSPPPTFPPLPKPDRREMRIPSLATRLRV